MQKVKMLNQENPDLRINFHINSSPWRHKHIHDYWEIQVMLSGYTVNEINEQTYILKENEVQILRPDDVHYFARNEKYKYDCLNLEIKKDFFIGCCNNLYPDILKAFGAESNIPVFVFEEDVMRKIRHNIIQAQQRVELINEERQFFLVEILNECLACFIKRNILHQESKYSFSDNFIKVMRSPENITLKLHEVVEKYPFGVEYVVRKFKQEGKDTPNKIFRKIKLEYSCGLLRTTEYSLALISEMIGFGSAAYFNKIFTREYGICPFSYRKKYYRR